MFFLPKMYILGVDTVALQANPSHPVVLTSHLDTGSSPVAPLQIQFHACDLRKQWKMAQILGPLLPSGKLRRIWISTNEALAVVVIWAVNQ